MIDISSLYESLLDATWRGLPFTMFDSRHEAGRRLQRTYFPGRDDQASQDLGVYDGPMLVRGIVIGDDYVNQALRLQQAFRTPGPGLLVHPWLGELLVILTKPASISFTQGELRAMRFEATFETYAPRSPPPADTLSALLDGWEDLQTQARGLLAAVLAPVALTLTAIGQVESFCSQVAGIVDAVVGDATGLANAVTGAVAGLGGVSALVVDDTYPAAVAALLGAPSAAIAATSASLTPAAIGPGDLAVTQTPLDARISTAALLAGCTQIAALGTLPAPGSALALATAAIVVADAVSAGTDIAYSSQQEAMAWMADLLASIDQVAAFGITLGPMQPVAAGLVWKSCQNLRARVIEDISAAIGRLPQVQTVTLIATTPVWLVAQGLAGDTPGNLLATYQDLVTRNGIRHPALAGPGDIEALVA